MPPKSFLVKNVRTVSDTKRAFYNGHTRPINSIFRRVVEELMVEMHLLEVNEDFHYDPIYALGVVTSFERFMQGYQPEKDKASIFTSLCQAQGGDPQKYQQDAQELVDLASPMSADQLIDWITQSASHDSSEKLPAQIRAIATNSKFKYSRLFAIGLFTLLELVDPELVKDEPKCTQALQQISTALNLPEGKAQKDLELYRSNLEKMAQARKMLQDILETDRKKRHPSTPEDSASDSAPDLEPKESPESQAPTETPQ